MLSAVAASILLALGLFFAAFTPITVYAQDPVTLRGHEGGISSIAVSPDGKLIASSSLDHTVRLWQAATGKLLRVLSIHKNEVYAVAFSPDDKTLASSDYDGKVILWDLTLFRPRLTLQIKGWSTSLSFSPDGALLAVANQGSGLPIFETKTGKLLRTLEIRGNTNVVAFSPDGRKLASASSSIALWDLENGKVEKFLRGHEDSVRTLAFSTDSAFLVSGSNDKTARLWKISSGEQVAALETRTPIAVSYAPKPLQWKMPVTAVAFSPDGKTIATALGRSVHLWEVSSGKNFQILEGPTQSVSSVAFFPDGKSIAAGSLDNMIRIWKLP